MRDRCQSFATEVKPLGGDCGSVLRQLQHLLGWLRRRLASSHKNSQLRCSARSLLSSGVTSDSNLRLNSDSADLQVLGPLKWG